MVVEVGAAKLNSKSLNTKYRTWLQSSVLPLWFTNGFNEKTGLFAENLDLNGVAVGSEHRSMVQARQIFSAHAFLQMGLGQSPALSPSLNEQVSRSAQTCIDRCQQTDGSYVQSIDSHGKIVNAEPVLYSQAFAIFGLAHAYQVTQKEEFKTAAKRVVESLQKSRALPSGGYVELIGGKKFYQSNPHMHLFEAAIQWLEAAPEKIWEDFADQIYVLCRENFYQREAGALCEHFDENWRPQSADGKYIFEPGHHYEWAWLLLRYGKLRSVDTFKFADSLFRTAENYGVSSAGLAYDEVWSTKEVKKATSRIWPQCERAKAAVLIAEKSSGETQKRAAEVANASIYQLLRYLQTERPGLWFEYIDEKGELHYQSGPVAKASTLYHVIGAFLQHDSAVSSGSL